MNPTGYTDPFPGRKGTERVTVTCGACGGDGLYKAPSRLTDRTGRTVCFKCNGAGSYSVLVSSVRAQARRHAVKAAERARQQDDIGAQNDRAAAELAQASPLFAEAWANPDKANAFGETPHHALWEALIARRDGMAIGDALDLFDYRARRRYLPQLHGANRFPKQCHVCGRLVPAGVGLLATNNDRPRVGPYWATYCAEHAPVETQPR